jgi:hypothetical protein
MGSEKHQSLAPQDVSEKGAPSERVGEVYTAGERLKGVLEHIRAKEVAYGPEQMRFRTSILADGGSIENQHMHFMHVEGDNSHPGRVEVAFKLTSACYELAKSRFAQAETAPLTFKNKAGEMIPFSDGWTIEVKEGVRLHLAQATQSIPGKEAIESRSSLGYVRVEIDEQLLTDPEAMGGELETLLETHFQIPKALAVPEGEDQERYKKARYAWLQKRSVDDIDEQEWAAISSRLTREAVAPNHSTFVLEGRSKELWERSRYACYHAVHGGPEQLVSMVQAGGLMSTTSRYERGMFISGMSSLDDIRAGGADYAFTRIATEASLKLLSAYAKENDQEEELDRALQLNRAYTEGKPFIVFEPDLLDRTDAFSYYDDKSGTTDPTEFAKRQSMDEVFHTQATVLGNSFSTNETMFQAGISAQKMKFIVCHPQISTEEALAFFSKKEISPIKGATVDQLSKMDPLTLRQALEASSADICRVLEDQDDRLNDQGIYGTGSVFRFKKLLNDLRDQRGEVQAAFRAAGIEKIGTRSIDDAIVTAKTYFDLIDLSAA